MFFSLCGVPGVGKTTVKQRVLKLASAEGLDIRDANNHRILYELAGVSSKLQYMQLPHTVRERTRVTLIEHLCTIELTDPSGIRLRDDHYSCPSSDGSYFLRPLHPVDDLYLAGIFILVTDPSTILARRVGDGLISRLDHANDTLASVAIHQFLEMNTACQQAAILGVPLRVFENTVGAVEEIACKILRFVRGYTSNTSE